MKRNRSKTITVRYRTLIPRPTPQNKTSAQWRAYSSTPRHDHGKNPLTSIMAEEKLRDLEKFPHWADSLEPETCGK